MKLPWIGIVLVAFIYFWIAYVQYANFRNGIDLGTYTQILYNISSFNQFPPFNSILGEIAWGDHAHFILILLAPFFALYQHALTPIILQILTITTAAWALCDIAQRRFHNLFYSYAILFSTLLFFGVQYAVTFDFHANVLTAALLAWVFWAYETDKKKLFWTLFLMSLITREDAPLFCGAFATYIILTNRQWRIRGAIALGISILYFFTITYFVMPAWESNHTAMAYFDADPQILLHPIKVIENMFDSSVKIRTTKNLFQSFGFLPLASPFTYLAATPNLLARFLSGEQQRWDMKMHYSASLVSILSYGSILGTAMLFRLFRRIPAFTKNTLAPTILLSILAISILLGTYTSSLRDIDLPLHQALLRTNTTINPTATAMRLHLEQVRNSIPQDDSVSTISSFVPFFATRESITNFTGVSEASATWVILSNKFTSWPLSRSELNTAIHDMRQRADYMEVQSENNLFVFKKD